MAPCDGTHLACMRDSSGTALVTWNGVFWRKRKRKGSDKHQRIQCTERKASHRGLVKSIKGPIRLWNLLSQPIRARSRVNKPPGLSSMQSLLLIDSLELDAGWPGQMLSLLNNILEDDWAQTADCMYYFPLLPSFYLSLRLLLYNHCPMNKNCQILHSSQTQLPKILRGQYLQEMLKFKGVVWRLFGFLTRVR